MSRLIPMSDLVADDLMLDRLAAREPAGSEPVAGLLAALADHADTPLTAVAGRRRTTRKHRYLGPFAALVVAASGAGVAAAVTVPHHAADQAERARVIREMEAAGRSDAPSALLSRLGLPRTTAGTYARGLVLARRGDGAIVLVPALSIAGQGPDDGRAEASADVTALSALPEGVASTDDLFGSTGGRSQADGMQPGRDDLAGASAGDQEEGDEQGADSEAGEHPSSATPLAAPTGTPVLDSTPKKPATGGSGSADGATAGHATNGAAATSASKGGKRPTTGSTPTVTPSVPPTAGSDAAAAGTTALTQTLVSPAPAPTKPRKQPALALPGGTTRPTGAGRAHPPDDALTTP